MRMPATSIVPDVRRRLLQEVDAAQQGALPGSRASEDDDDLAGLHLEMHSLQHDVVPERFPQAVHDDVGCRARRARRGAHACGTLVWPAIGTPAVPRTKPLLSRRSRRDWKYWKIVVRPQYMIAAMSNASRFRKSA